MKKAPWFGLLLAVLALAALAASPAFGGGGPPDVKRQVVSASGTKNIQGQRVIVDILLQVEPGQDPANAANRALKRYGATPLDSAALGSEGFQTFGIVWDTGTAEQYYNPANEPFPSQAVFERAQDTWNLVDTSDFSFTFVETTIRCASLIPECGEQSFDGFNDRIWKDLGGFQGGFITLAVTWVGLSTDEADVAFNTNLNIKWVNTTDENVVGYDVETVDLHEQGHVLGLGHSLEVTAVMAPYYTDPQRSLTPDDIEGITFLYDNLVTGGISGTVTDPDGNPVNGATVSLDGTSISTKRKRGGTYRFTNLPDPVHYGVTAEKDGRRGEARVWVNGAIVVPSIVISDTAIIDIAITDLSAPTSTAKGDSIWVNFTVANVGNQDVSGKITTNVSSDNATPGDATDDITIGTQLLVAGLSAGSSFVWPVTWDTTNANLGEHIVTAAHTFSDDNSANNSLPTTVSLTADAGTVRIHDLGIFLKKKGNLSDAEARITISNVNGAAVSGAVVTVEWSKDNFVSKFKTDTQTTDGGGRATFQSGRVGSSGDFIYIRVADVAKTGSDYVSDKNTKTDAMIEVP